MNALCLLDYSFDLTRLNALTVDFYHPVLAVEENNVAILAHFNDIACLEELFKSVLLLKRVINKGFCGLLGQTNISVGKDTCNAELAFVRLFPVFVENMRADAADRLTDRCVIIRLVDLKMKYRACGLCLSVHNINFKFIAADVGNTLAAGQNSAQTISLLLKHLEHFRADKCTVDLIFLYIISKQYRIAHCFKGHKIRDYPGAKRSEYTLNRGYKCERRA